MNNKGVLFTILFLINIVLFAKLKFFIPQLFGGANLIDFQAYYRLAKDLIIGTNPYAVSYMQTLGPPSVLFYFLPFSIFNYPTAKFLFTIINVICGFAMCLVLAKYFFRNTHRPRSASHTSEVKTPNLYKINIFLMLTLLFFSSFPVRFSIENGQPNLVICYLVGLLICSKKGRFWTRRVPYGNPSSQNDDSTKVPYILASIIILKTNYIISLVSLLKKNKQLVIITFLSILCILIFLFPIINPSLYTYYLGHKIGNLFPSVSSSTQLNYYNQSIPARLNFLGLGNVSIMLYAVVIIFILWIVYKSQNLLLGIISSIILSPVSWQHYYAVLFPIFVLCFVTIFCSKKILKPRQARLAQVQDDRRRKINLVLVLTSFFFWWIEFPFLHNAPVNFFTAIFSSHHLISAFILFLVIYKNLFRPHSASNDVK